MFKKKVKVPVAPLRASSHNKSGNLVMDDALRTTTRKEAAPLKQLDDWDDFVAARYQPGKSEAQFRNYRANRTAASDKVHLSFGHDEYIYQVARNYLPEEGLCMLRYHSFYAAHRHNAYRHLMSVHDEERFAWVRKFNPYDLYSKGRGRPDMKAILPFYQDLVSEFFPDKIDW